LLPISLNNSQPSNKKKNNHQHGINYKKDNPKLKSKHHPITIEKGEALLRLYGKKKRNTISNLEINEEI